MDEKRAIRYSLLPERTSHHTLLRKGIDWHDVCNPEFAKPSSGEHHADQPPLSYLEHTNSAIASDGNKNSYQKSDLAYIRHLSKPFGMPEPDYGQDPRQS
jgi:hypothetical protein